MLNKITSTRQVYIEIQILFFSHKQYILRMIKSWFFRLNNTSSDIIIQRLLCQGDEINNVWQWLRQTI